MKFALYSVVFCAVIMSSIITTPAAHALSCLPTDMYLSGVIGDEETLVFIATSVERTDTAQYTSEVVTVDEALQGYVDSDVFVYHERHPDWDYLCNAGPQAEGTQGVYVVYRDAFGTYNVTQRLTLDEKITTDFLAEIKAAEVEGGISDMTAVDQQNLIMTTITELLERIQKLLVEFRYWQSQS